jgi:N-hydroxyarylamine O-acetyltransferase
VDPNDYLSRIGAEAPRGPTAKALQQLHFTHLREVPFENLDIYLGVPIVLDQERILRKVVAHRRGGFCYELNTAFHWLLTELGFRVDLLSAEVARPGGGFGIPFDHMALLVEIDDDLWLADVGFGDSFVYPLRLAQGGLHEESEYRYRLTRHEPHWHLERAPLDADHFETQYRFTTTPRVLEDFRGGCEYHQTAPESTFTQKVLATRALENGRVTVTRDRVILRQGPRGMTRSETPLADDEAFRSALWRHFGIHLELP